MDVNRRVILSIFCLFLAQCAFSDTPDKPAASADPPPRLGTQARLVRLARVQGYINPATREAWMRAVPPDPDQPPPPKRRNNQVGLVAAALEATTPGYCELEYFADGESDYNPDLTVEVYPQYKASGDPDDAPGFTPSECAPHLDTGFEGTAALFDSFGVCCFYQHIGNFMTRTYDHVYLDIDESTIDAQTQGPYIGTGVAQGTVDTPEGRNRPHQKRGLWDFGYMEHGDTKNMWVFFHNLDPSARTWNAYVSGTYYEICDNGRDDDCDGIEDNGCHTVSQGGQCYADDDCMEGNFCVGAEIHSSLGEDDGSLADDIPGVCLCDTVDSDTDGLGDSCDPCKYDPGNDPDGDDVCAADDNCPDDANSDQQDTDEDGVGDACECNNVTCDSPPVCRTTGSCLSTTGECYYPHASDYSPCNDNNECTDGEQCFGGSCTNGSPVDCDDSKDCTTDSCDPATGCLHDALSDGTLCDADSNPCTVDDACSDGTCYAGDPADCADDDPCTIDSCNSVTGCIHETDTQDTDTDGTCDNGDSDDDNDGVSDVDDDASTDPDVCRDEDGDGCDDCSIGTDDFGPDPDYNTADDGTDTDTDGQCNTGDPDDDNDTVSDGIDNCPLIYNPDQDNNDLDAMGDVCDPDDDNDTVSDGIDNCPLVYNPDQDNNDLDAMGDVCDPDDDNDTVSDGPDNCPLIANPGQLDGDVDGWGDVCDNCPGLANDQTDSDADGVGDACDAPPEWNCVPGIYGGGDGCDCGCGALDPDCDDATVGSCDLCAQVGSCAVDRCPSNINSVDNSRCVAEGWRCSGAYYEDGATCDCGCGAPDPDCDPNYTSGNCDNCNLPGSCGVGTCPSNISSADNSTCDVPGAWTCLQNRYGDGTNCDCGCGALDPDCWHRGRIACYRCQNTGGLCGSGTECPRYIDVTDNSRCVVEGWNCSADAYSDGTSCDCGCGIADPDCDGDAITDCDTCHLPGSCGTDDCPANIWDGYNYWCTEQQTWTAGQEYYNDHYWCDCGYGAVDPDCHPPTIDSCEYCNDSGVGLCNSGWDGCSPLYIDYTDISQCAPVGWTCSVGRWQDGTDCDCGCGVQDPDCNPDYTPANCDTCDLPGSCGIGPPCGSSNINSTNNALCDAPTGWTCAAAWYNDGDCDCGCGVPDSDADCEDNTVASCKYCGQTDMCAEPYACPATVHPKDNSRCAWTCDIDYYVDSDCDCGCGVRDIYGCPDSSSSSCDFCGPINLPGSCSLAPLCPGSIDASDNSRCNATGWNCAPELFDAGDGICHCGCGIVDLDCADATAAECDECLTTGSCATVDCMDIFSLDSAVCNLPSPSGWTCHPSLYGDTVCDCGCGAEDSDCGGYDPASCQRCPNMVGSCSASDCTDIDNTYNYLCK
jgi:hypothetical protein